MRVTTLAKKLRKQYNADLQKNRAVILLECFVNSKTLYFFT